MKRKIVLAAAIATSACGSSHQSGKTERTVVHRSEFAEPKPQTFVRPEPAKPLSSTDIAIEKLKNMNLYAIDDAYSVLAPGMTVQEANKRLQAEGLEIGNNRGVATLSWPTKDGLNVVAEFDHDRLVTKKLNPSN